MRKQSDEIKKTKLVECIQKAEEPTGCGEDLRLGLIDFFSRLEAAESAETNRDE